MPGLPKVSRGQPDADGVGLGSVHGDASGSDHKAQEFDLLSVEQTLFGLGVQIVLAQTFQHTSDVNPMIFKGVGEDEDIVEVDHYKDVSHVSEDVIHEGLERSGSIGESHGHNQEFERAISGAKCCLPLMASSDANIVVASPQVELSVDLGTAKLVKEVGNKRNRVPILPGELVEVPEIDTESQGPVFLFCEQDWGTCWGLGRSYEPFAKHIVEELAKETELSARERVDVAMRRCLVILEVNFVIKLAMRRHVISLIPGEHIKEILIHLGDDLGEEFGLIGGQGLRV